MLTWECNVCRMPNRGRDTCARCGSDKGVEVRQLPMKVDDLVTGLLGIVIELRRDADRRGPYDAAGIAATQHALQIEELIMRFSESRPPSRVGDWNADGTY